VTTTGGGLPRSAALVVAALAAALAGAEPAGAVVGGSIDNTRAAVGFVYDQVSDTACSGTLIAPAVVLTAAHCLVGDPTAANYLVSFDVMPFATPLDFVAVSEVHPQPAFDPGTLTHDVGVLVLATPSGVTPLPWLDVDPGGVYAAGQGFVASGFGETTPQSGAGTRRSVAIAMDAVGTASFTHDQSDGFGICAGDSGGPAIVQVDSVETVVGVASFGDQACAQYSLWDRTDAEASFIASFAPEPGAGTCGRGAALALALAARRRTCSS